MTAYELEMERLGKLKRSIILEKEGGEELLNLAKKGEVILNSKELALILGISRKYCNKIIDEFLEIIISHRGNYPKYSVIRPSTKIRLVWFLPFLHFFTFRKMFGTFQEKYIPPYTSNFFDRCF